MSWSSAVEGDCISIKFSNSSQFSKTPCTLKLNYICEVILELFSFDFSS
jgi:hypothetical protein